MGDHNKSQVSNALNQHSSVEHGQNQSETQQFNVDRMRSSPFNPAGYQFEERAEIAKSKTPPLAKESEDSAQNFVQVSQAVESQVQNSQKFENTTQYTVP